MPRIRLLLCPMTLLGLAGSIQAQCPGVPYGEGFDTLVGSPTGTGLAGQAGFFIPVAGSLDALVHTYAGNSVTTNAGPVTVNPNPRGGLQFASSTSTVVAAVGTFSRAQHDVTYDNCTRWVLSTDICVLPNAVDTNNIASISLAAPSTNTTLVVKQVILLARWVVGSFGTRWNADIVQSVALPATPTTAVTGLVPNVGFQNLATNTWYRWECVFDLTTNELVLISITNLSTNVAATHTNTAMYLLGGAASPHPNPAGFRLFGGTLGAATALGNTVCWDNVSCHPWSPAGAGCVGTAGEPYLTALNGAVSGGAPFTMVVSNLPPLTPLVIYVLGLTNTITPLGLPPADLGFLGIVGLGPTTCNLHIHNDLGLLFVGAGGGVSSLSIAIPPGYAGIPLFSQVGVIDVGLNPANLSLSNAGRADLK